MYAEHELKVCSDCKKTKEKKEFGRDCTNPTGYYSSCKECKRIKRSRRRKLSPEEHKLKDFISDLKNITE